MGKRRRRPKQTSMWVATQDLPRTAAHPFYTRLNQIRDTADFDGYVEALCQRFYARRGWPPGSPAGPLRPVAADRVLRRVGRGARHRVACGRLVCAARVPRVGAAGRTAGSFDDFPHASLDRSRDVRGGVHMDAAAGRMPGWSQARPSASMRPRCRPRRRCGASCDATPASATRTS